MADTKSIWKALTATVLRATDITSWQNARLAAVEERLAALDGGPTSDSARRQAMESVNARRIAAGQRQLGFGLNGTGDAARLEWVTPETRGDR